MILYSLYGLRGSPGSRKARWIRWLYLKVHEARDQLSHRQLLLLPVTRTGMIAIAGWIGSAFIYTAVHVYADTREGGGGSWGVGFGVGNLEGNLRHAPWSTLRSAENDFHVQSFAAGVGMEFFIGGSYITQFVGANLGVMVAAGFNG